MTDAAPEMEPPGIAVVPAMEPADVVVTPEAVPPGTVGVPADGAAGVGGAPCELVAAVGVCTVGAPTPANGDAGPLELPLLDGAPVCAWWPAGEAVPAPASVSVRDASTTAPAP